MPPAGRQTHHRPGVGQAFDRPGRTIRDRTRPERAGGAGAGRTPACARSDRCSARWPGSRAPASPPVLRRYSARRRCGGSARPDAVYACWNRAGSKSAGSRSGGMSRLASRSARRTPISRPRSTVACSTTGVAGDRAGPGTDVVNRDVVGVAVAAGRVVGGEHVGRLLDQDVGQPPGRRVAVGVGERVGMHRSARRPCRSRRSRGRRPGRSRARRPSGRARRCAGDRACRRTRTRPARPRPRSPPRSPPGDPRPRRGPACPRSAAPRRRGARGRRPA